MCISPLYLDGWIFDEANISLGVFKQQIIKNFKVVFLSFIFTYNRAIEHNNTVIVRM